MKNIQIKYIILFIFAYCNISCNKENLENEHISNRYNLVMHVTQSEYGSSTTKASYQWPDGAKLHIMFSNKNNTAQWPGTATYNKASDSWQIESTQGELHRGDSALCTITYLEGYSNGEVVELDPSNVIYEDSNAKYFLDENTLTISGSLAPKTARLRFAGTAGTQIKLFGAAHYNIYHPHYNNFGFSTDELELTVTEDGYTPYVHIFFPNNLKRLELTDSNNRIFVFKCSDRHLAPGVSGYFNIPDESNKGGWTMYNAIHKHTIPGTNVEFNMVYIKWIEGSFYIAETETTQKLWKAVMNQNPSFHLDENLNLPVENIEGNSVKPFTEAIMEITGYPFTLPTFHQWFYAARGGIKSKGYLYSGSNNLDDVAWYKDNSDGVSHSVKTKAPNELGLYDMNGNVNEYTFSPNYSGDNYKYAIEHWYTNSYGGSFEMDNSRTNNSYDYFALTPDFDDLLYSYRSSGFRLCLNL